MTFTPGILAILPLVTTAFAPQSGPTRAPLLDQRQLQLAMARLATEHPALVSVLPIVRPQVLPAETRGKRRLEVLRVAAGRLDPGRPAILVVANIDGPLVWTSGVALDHAQQLADGYASDARIKALLDKTTIYIVPRANPDAAEARFATPLSERAATGTGVDNDRDGRQGEDPPADVDADGKIVMMRVRAPDGDWMIDPNDPRAMIKADASKGQAGAWKLWPEGRDADKDEKVAEDSELDAVVNRNFPQGWVEHAPESGLFATDEPETRALAEFVLNHPEIALVVTYGMLDNLVEKPKSEAKEPRRSASPSDGIPDADAAIYAELGKRFKQVSKGSKSAGKDAGTFQAWVQAQRGLWTVNLATWQIPLDEAAPKKEGEGAPPKEGDAKDSKDKKKEKADEPADDAKRLIWIDAKSESARFVAWHPFQHPDLGAVEIGGFAPYALIEPPDAERAEIAQKNLEFLIQLGDMLPRIRISEATARELSGSMWKIEATIQNDSLLPLVSQLGKRTGVVRPARVDLELPADAHIVAGNAVQLVPELGGSGGRKEFTWIVRGAPPSAIKVRVDSDYAGTATAVLEVK
jgi:hypothetical protein